MALNVETTTGEDRATYHTIGGVSVQCGGSDCVICNYGVDKKFLLWVDGIPYPVPPKGKRYKRKIPQDNRGKTIQEICYSCREIPCFICRRDKCPEWMKEKHRVGQEEGCVHWEKGRCKSFVCERGIVKGTWHDL